MTLQCAIDNAITQARVQADTEPSVSVTMEMAKAMRATTGTSEMDKVAQQNAAAAEESAAAAKQMHEHARNICAILGQQQ